MATLKAIRSRIKSVKNTQKITRAMKLVAAARLRRAQDAVVSSRPYAKQMRNVIVTLAGAVPPESNPLFRRAEPGNKCLLVPITGDRGLCGAYNASVIRRTEVFLRESKEAWPEIGLAPIGRKGRDYFRRRGMSAWLDTAEMVTGPNFASASRVAREIIRIFAAGEVDAVYLIYAEFVSALTQRVVVEPLLPLSKELFAPGAAAETESPAEFVYEPNRTELLDHLLPRFVESQVYRALVEAQASETGARMTAMDNASRNASEIISALALQMNRLRQAVITKELMEITSGAEALRG